MLVINGNKMNPMQVAELLAQQINADPENTAYKAKEVNAYDYREFINALSLATKSAREVFTHVYQNA